MSKFKVLKGAAGMLFSRLLTRKASSKAPATSSPTPQRGSFKLSLISVLLLVIASVAGFFQLETGLPVGGPLEEAGTRALCHEIYVTGRVPLDGREGGDEVHPACRRYVGEGVN